MNQTPGGKKSEVASMSIWMMTLYAFANIGANVIDSAFEQFGAVLYVEHKFITYPIFFGIAVMCGRIVDALANPVVGYVSDTSYGRLGRRIPFILKGTIPLALFFVMFFYPATQSGLFGEDLKNAKTVTTTSTMVAYDDYKVEKDGTVKVKFQKAQIQVGEKSGPVVRNEKDAAGVKEQAGAIKFSKMPPLEKKKNIINFIYAALTCSLMLFFFTYSVAPYLALLPDIARSNEDRIKLSSFQAITGILGIVIGFVGTGVLVKMFQKGPGMESKAYYQMAVVCAVMVVFTFFVTAFTIKEKPIEKKDRLQMNFWGSILPTLKNKAFIFYVVSLSSFWIGFKVLSTSIVFVCMHMFGKDETFGAIFGMGGMIAVWMIATPFVFFLQKKWGKRRMFSGALLMIAIISALQGFIGMVPKEFGLFYYIGLVFMFGIPFAALIVLYNAIVGDIIDLDEKVTGHRREAMFYGMEGLFTKIARGFGAVLIMFLFTAFGKPAANNHMALIVSGPVCAAFSFIGFLVFSKYPIKD